MPQGWEITHGPHDFSVSPSPFGTNFGFELGCTGLGLGLGGIGTKGLGPGLDKSFEKFCTSSSLGLRLVKIVHSC